LPANNLVSFHNTSYMYLLCYVLNVKMGANEEVEERRDTKLAHTPLPRLMPLQLTAHHMKADSCVLPLLQEAAKWLAWRLACFTLSHPRCTAYGVKIDWNCGRVCNNGEPNGQHRRWSRSSLSIYRKRDCDLLIGVRTHYSIAYILSLHSFIVHTSRALTDLQTDSSTNQ
jgi:hypothetical protein